MAAKGPYAHSLMAQAVNDSSPDSQKLSEIEERYEPEKPSALRRFLGGKPRVVEVWFHHAGYDPDLYINTLMFRLKGRGGVSWNLVALIMLALCAHREDYQTLTLSLTRGGPPIKNLSHGSLLNECNYYIRCKNPDDPEDLFYQFPLVPSLACWDPRDYVPSFWHHLAPKGMNERKSGLRTDEGPEAEKSWIKLCHKQTLKRDEKCVLSGATFNCRRAYLVPHVDEQLQRPGWNTHHPENVITLRADLRRLFNNGAFVIVPRGRHFVAHFFNPRTEVARKYNQQPVRLSEEIPKERLLFRVAMKAFELVGKFMEQEEARWDEDAPVHWCDP